MENESASRFGRVLLYVALALALALCLWAGWRDFSPWIPHAEIRENIQLTVRFLLQITVQFVVPAAITGFFVKEALTRRRLSRRSSRGAA